MLEESDEYHQIDDLAFLRMLRDEGSKVAAKTTKSPADEAFERLFSDDNPSRDSADDK